jgi:hypothetical protein
MTIALRGRSVELKEKIESLEQQQEIFRRAMPDYREPKLEELRRNLERELATKRLVLLATSHDAQQEGNPKNDALGKRLSYLARRFAPTILMEEWAEDCPTSFSSSFANCIAADYKNVGTPPEERFRTFCNAPIIYPGHDGTLGPCADAPEFYEYGPLEKQENRELQMTQNIEKEMKDHQVGLFVFGLAHLHSMSLKLHHLGFNVAAYSWLA